MGNSRNTIGRRLAAIGMMLAVAFVGCSDAEPVEEVRAGGSTTTSPVVGGPGGTGSGGSGGSVGGTEPGRPGPIDPSPPVREVTPPPAGDAPDPRPVDPDPGDRRHPHPWDGFTVGADGRTLTFTYYAGVAPCSVFDSIVVDEGADAVRVTIYEHSGPDGVACIMLAQQKSASVTLDTPLGGRTLVDGAVAA